MSADNGGPPTSIKTSASSTFDFKVAKTLDIYLLGISIIIGGQSFSWNTGLESCFWEYFTDMILAAIGYYCLTLTVAEMTSALPFSGGIYGLTRVALNPYLGFLVGFFETIHNILYVSAAVLPLGMMLTYAMEIPRDYEPLLWFIMLFITLLPSLGGGYIFWTFNRILGLVSLFLILMYTVTPIVNYTNFNKYAAEDLSNTRDTHYNVYRMFRASPLATWFYIGVEILPFTAGETKTPTKSVPWAMIICMTTNFITSFPIMFGASSQAPGIAVLWSELLPLSFGYSKMLGITMRQASWLSIYPVFATVLGFMYGCGRQVSSLSLSGLFPSILKHTTVTHAPYAALIASGIIAFLVMLLVHYKLEDDVNYLFHICILGSIFVYNVTFMTYISFKKKYPSLKREFINPLGNYAAYIGMIVFSIFGVSIIGLQDKKYEGVSPVSFVIIFIIGSMYYFLYASKRQYYSEEEQKAFLITYVINSNTRGRKKIKHTNKYLRVFYLFFHILHKKVTKSIGSFSNNRKSVTSFDTSSVVSGVNKYHHGDDGSVISKGKPTIGPSTLTSVAKEIELEEYQINQNINDNKVEVSQNGLDKSNSDEKRDIESAVDTNNNNEESIDEDIHLPPRERQQFESLKIASKHNSLDFSQLPSVDVLEHIQQEMELSAKNNSHKNHHHHHVHHNDKPPQNKPHTPHTPHPIQLNSNSNISKSQSFLHNFPVINLKSFNFNFHPLKVAPSESYSASQDQNREQLSDNLDNNLLNLTPRIN